MDNTDSSFPEQTDFDSPWKEIIELYFPQFMAFFFPEAFEQIDWTQEYTFLDKELQQIVRDAEIGTRRVDKLVDVALQNGAQVWILIHIEVQGQREAEFPERMYVYNYRLFDRHHRQVVSMAVLTDENPGWRPQRFGYEQLGCRVLLDFPMAKLLDYRQRWDWLEANDNPFAVVTMAHLQTQATRHDPQERYAAKLRLAKLLYQREYNRKQILELFRFIDWLMTLPPDLDKQFEVALEEYETEVKMRYVTTIERRAMERGLERGLEQGLLQILELRFGPVPASLQGEIEALPAPALQQLIKAALEAGDLDAFKEELDALT